MIPEKVYENDEYIIYKGYEGKLITNKVACGDNMFFILNPIIQDIEMGVIYCKLNDGFSRRMVAKITDCCHDCGPFRGGYRILCTRGLNTCISRLDEVSDLCLEAVKVLSCINANSTSSNLTSEKYAGLNRAIYILKVYTDNGQLHIPLNWTKSELDEYFKHIL